MSERELLRRTADLAADYLDSLDTRPVFPPATAAELAAALGGPLPERPSEPLEVVERLAADAEPGVVGSAGGRYFGFVLGGGVPAALAADWLVTTWDQCAGMGVMGLSASVVEDVAGDWLKELLGLPAGASFAFTTGCQMAHVTALAAARHSVLERAGWDLPRQGLAGSPPITVIVGARRHVTVDRGLRLLGIGADQLAAVAADDQGRMRPAALEEALAALDGPCIVCAQAGEVNTGAFDPLGEIADLTAAAGAWLHVDGAFGLWAAASPSYRQLVEGVERADSWAADGHKWLNVPYDSGLMFCAHPDAHRAAMTARADVPRGGRRVAARRLRLDARVLAPGARVPALRRDPLARPRGRGRAGGPLLRAGPPGGGGPGGAAGLHAAQRGGAQPGAVPLRGRRGHRRRASRVQQSGEAWLGGTSWDGRAAIRLSVSSWRTTEDDIARTLAAFAEAVEAR